MAIKNKELRSKFNKVGLVFFIYAILCFLTSIWFNSTLSSSVITKQLPAVGGLVGPINNESSNSVYKVEVSQSVNSYGDWSYVEGEVLDKEKQYLFSFSDEVWKETGSDSDGTWYEQKNDFNIKIVLKEEGLYFFNFKTEMKGPNAGGPLMVKVLPKRASSLIHFIMGIISIVLCFGTWFVANAQEDKA